MLASSNTLLDRPRLRRQLESALHRGHLLITAPAGFGKTMLLHNLAVHRPATFYFQLTPADLDLVCLRARLESHLSSNHTLLLDDIDLLVEAEAVYAWLAEQMQQAAPRLVLAGRQLPSTWSELAAVAPVSVLEATALSFSARESRALLESGGHMWARVRGWHEQMEGWPLGMGLLARMPAERASMPTIREQLFPYLARAVFDQLPPDLRHYLQISAVPLQFNDELAAHLLKETRPELAAATQSLRQRVQQRNLFLYHTAHAGWYRYHDLIRDYLLTSMPDKHSLFERVVTWHQDRGDLENAIEHALAGGLHERAARLMERVKDRILDAEGRPMTFYRWVETLDAPVRQAHPALPLHLAAHMHYLPGYARAAQEWTETVRKHALLIEDLDTFLRASLQLAHFDLLGARFEEAVTSITALMPSLERQLDLQRAALQFLAIAYCATGQYQAARPTFERAIALYEQANEPLRALNLRQNMAVMLFIPLGRYGKAAAILQEVLAIVEDSNWRFYYLTNWCELCLLQGKSVAFQAAVTELATLEPVLEIVGAREALWTSAYRALAALQEGDASVALRLLEEFPPIQESWQLAVRGSLLVQLRRTEQRFGQLASELDALLDDDASPSFERAQLALERDIAWAVASGWGRQQRIAWHPETLHLIRWRARAEFVRLRALLALLCWQAGNGRWRRHAHAALFALRRYEGYEHLLTYRDRELGGHFWAMLLAEGLALNRAQTALETIGEWRYLLPLLQHEEAPVRGRAASMLARIGREEAMPALVSALGEERDPDTAGVLDRALLHLETQAPPPLRVQLMGEFVLWRGEERTPETAWPRPIVRRLFQYFVLHRGEALPRDRILDDLWPENDPHKAASTFRTVYSGLRSVLEPYMRPRTTSRYFSVEGNLYTFDPRREAQVDVALFEETVRSVLSAGERHDLSPLPHDFLARLQEWAPLLPGHTYEEWLLEPRERLQRLYTESCLYAAQANLARGNAAEAAVWAGRAIATAPWLESAYQVLMRAHARQGNRTLALKIYRDAIAALDRELGIAPSELTNWLAARLRDDESI